MKFKTNRRPPYNWEVYSIEDFVSRANETLDEFLRSFTEEEGLIIKIEDYVDVEEIPDGISFLYHPRGSELYDRMQRRLIELGVKCFGECFYDEEVYSDRIREL